MRLTRKTMFSDYALEEYDEKSKNVAINKLGKLEDIEDKLGIDISILFKAFDGIVYKKDNEIKFSCHIALIDWAIYVLEESMTIGEGICLQLKDYGKTWALTKEELL